MFGIRCSAFAFGFHLLNSFIGVSVNYRLVNILEDFPVFFGILKSFLVLEVLGKSFEIDNITTVFLLCKNLLYRCLAPLIRVRLSFLTAFVKTFLRSVADCTEEACDFFNDIFEQSNDIIDKILNGVVAVAFSKVTEVTEDVINAT